MVSARVQNPDDTHAANEEIRAAHTDDHALYPAVGHLKADVFTPSRWRGDLRELDFSLAGGQGCPPMLFRRRFVRRGEPLFAAGDVSSSIYEVFTGCFKTCITDEHGRQQVCGFQIVGDLVGLDGVGSEREVSAGIALEDSQVNVVPMVLIGRLSQESAEFQHVFHKIMSREGQLGRHMMFVLGSMNAKERVATFLLDLLQRLNARGYSASEVNLCMTRDEIGSYLGLTIETVSRTFTTLRLCGTLEVTGRFVRIVDPEALRRAAVGLP